VKRITNWIGTEELAYKMFNVKSDVPAATSLVSYKIFKAKTLHEHRLIEDMIRFAKLNYKDCERFKAYSAESLRKLFICYGAAMTGSWWINAPIGYALWNYDRENLVLRQIAVTYPAYQRCGIGRKLWQTSLDDQGVDLSHVIIESPGIAFLSWLVCNGLLEGELIGEGEDAEVKYVEIKGGVRLASYG